MIRGLHIDLCRHFIEFETIMQTIDLMAKLQFNVLHLHMSDDQSFPFESITYPKIKFNKMLTIQNQIDIALACKKYSIEIIPEIDIPGHTQALRHIFDDEPLETKLGIITTSYIDLDKYMPIVFNLFEEYITRFDAKYIHIGCDEAKQFTKFPELISMVAHWCNIRKLYFIVWDDVVSKIDVIPNNMIVHRWRHYTSGKIASMNIPYILSEDYYLDHCNDPLYMYNKKLDKYGGNLIGYIACTWSELIDNNNFHSTIVPSIYLLSKKWTESQNDYRNIPEVLYNMCEQYGYPSSKFNNEWRKRKWAGFNAQNDPRASNSVDVNVPLDRDHDQYPVFSKFLVNLVYCLYLLWIKKEPSNTNYMHNELDKIIKENFDVNYDVSWLFDTSTDIDTVKNNINQLVPIMKAKNNQYYHNGLLAVFRYLYWNLN